jgi:predicted GIY-YIG superfamily endonuclease
MLLCDDGSYYVGHTDDLRARVTEHEQGSPRCCYTAKRCPVRLVWSQEFAARDEANAAERTVGGWNRAKKGALIRGDFEAVSAAARKRDWSGYRKRRDASAPFLDTPPNGGYSELSGS